MEQAMVRAGLATPLKKALMRRDYTLWTIGGALLLLACSAPWMSDYALQIAYRVLLMASLAEAWNLLAGYVGLVSLGTASFVGVGAYVFVALVNHAGIPYALAIPAGGLAAALLAVVVSRAVFRLRGLYFTVGTLALAEALRLFMVNNNAFGGAVGLFLDGDSPDLDGLFWMAWMLAAVSTALITLVTQSRLSVLFKSVRDDEDAAAQIAVRPFRIKLTAFVLASFLMGMGGALQGLKLGAVEPYGIFGIQWTVDVLSIVIIGGQGLRLGAVVGTVLVVALSELLADYPAVHLALTGVILIVVIRFAPKGVVGLCGKLFDRVTRK